MWVFYSFLLKTADDMRHLPDNQILLKLSNLSGRSDNKINPINARFPKTDKINYSVKKA